MTRRSARRGTVMVYMTVGMVAFAGLVSLGVDAAHCHLVKTQLQTAADAAARYAIVGFATNLGTAQNNAVTAAQLNTADGTPVTLNPNTDIEFGTWMRAPRRSPC